MRTLRLLPATTLAAVLLAGCSSTSDEPPAAAAPSTSSIPSPSSSTAPATTAPPTSSAPAGCATAGPVPPDGAVTREVGDVDGDGRPDTAWLAPAAGGAVSVGIGTAAGGSSAADVTLTGPSARSLLVADADGDGRFEMFVSDGRTVDLYAFDGCAVQPVLNREGTDYQFDLGFRGNGTGLGCTRVGDGQHLVGLLRTEQSATSVGWTRTVVELDGLQARNGATDSGSYALPAGQAQADLLSQVTCGDLTMQDDGLVLPG